MEKQISVLIADDDIKLLNLIKTYLQNNGYQVFTASDGKEALKATDLYLFDIIISDWMMPKMDGLEFVKQLRKKNSVPVLMLTALSELDNKVDAYENGIDDYLSKP
ncbi:MAG: response regulator, partial [Rickettsiales bacterium]|nr:response regulator [Rickettsiales bacterium]